MARKSWKRFWKGPKENQVVRKDVQSQYPANDYRENVVLSPLGPIPAKKGLIHEGFSKAGPASPSYVEASAGQPACELVSEVAVSKEIASKGNVSASSARSHTDGADNEDARISAEALARNNAAFYTHNLRGDQIRLLVVYPGEGNDHIICDLEAIDLKEEPEFDALSYCWSNMPEISTITVNGVEGFRVQDHMFRALRRLRREFSKRCVWIDAICINQANEEEKSRQVARMGSIYRTTKQCVIWLGESEPDESNCRIRPDGFCTAPGLSSVTHGNVLQMFNTKIKSDEELSMTKEFWHRVWWKRLWVLQEFALPYLDPKIMIGPHTISWDFFTQLEWHNGDREHLLFKLRKGLREPKSLERRRVSDGFETFSLYDLLLMTAGKFSCSDPRDRIFSLLGLVNTYVAIRVDYSTSVQNLYADALLYIIERHDTLDPLLDGRDSRLEQECASWIPDVGSLQPPHLVKSADGYCASSHSPVVALLQTPSRALAMLKFKGAYFNKVVSRISIETVDVPIGKFCISRDGIIRKTRSDDVLQHITDTNGLYPFPESVLDEVSNQGFCASAEILRALSYESTSKGRHRLDRLPQLGLLMLEYIFNGTCSLVQIMGRAVSEERVKRQTMVTRTAENFGLKATGRVLHDLEVASIWEDVFSLKWHCRQKCTAKTVDDLNDQKQERVRRLFASSRLRHVDVTKCPHLYESDTIRVQTPDAKSGTSNITMTGKYRTFFKTEDNFIGLGPEDLDVGDHVVVPLGSSRPWILRKDGEYYKLLGSAVIPSIMSGELMDFYDEGTLAAADFVLL